MENLLIIKNIYYKLYFHPFFYIIVFLSFVTGHFRNILYFTLIILVHELGHSFTGIILKARLKQIELYPYGGCSRLEYDVNISLFKEFLIVVMGPLVQIFFMLLVYYLKIAVPKYFYTYNQWILLFNLLPIYPLDGGKLINIIVCFFISFFSGFRLVFYLSYLSFNIILFCSIFKFKNLIIYIILIGLGIEFYKEYKKFNYVFNKFLLERHLNNYNFSKVKNINSIYQMRREYYHLFAVADEPIEEKKYLKTYFFV